MTATTLKDLAGTNRGLGNLTIEELHVLLAEHAPVKVTGKAKGSRTAKTDKAAKSKFYTDVIVGKREEREAHRNVNRQASAWMREKGLVPSGQAWAAVKSGERSVTKLRALNEADGLAPLKMKAEGVKAVVAEKAERVEAKREARATRAPRKAKAQPKAEVVEVVEVKAEVKARAPRKPKATKPVEPVLEPVTEEPKITTDEETVMIETLVAAGYTEAQAREVLNLKKA